MSTITTLASSDTLSASRSTINSNFQAQQETFINAASPGSPRAGQFWIDSTTATEVLKVYDGAAWRVVAPDVFGTTGGGGNLPLSGGTMTGAIDMGTAYKVTGLAAATAGGDAVNKTVNDARTMCAPYYLGTLSATATFPLFLTPQSYTKIQAAYLVTSTALATSGAAYWSFGMYNVTDTAYLQSGTGPTTPTGARLTASTYTGGTATVANTPYSMALDQNQGDLAATLAASKVIQLIATKTGAPSNLSDCTLFVWYRVST